MAIGQLSFSRSSRPLTRPWRRMLTLALSREFRDRQQAGYFDLGRLYGHVPGITDE